MAPAREPSSWKALADVGQVGLTLVISTVIGLTGGYYLDRWLGTSPWLILIGLGLGVAAGFVSLFRSVKSAERKLDDLD
jgi:ATP synthase protein I